MSRLGGSQRGFSLSEALVSTFFVALFGVVLHEFHRTVFRSVRVQEERAQAEETARVAIEIMVRELRTSGYSAAGRPLPALRVAAVDHLVLQTDLGGDGDTSDPNETLTYRYDGERHALMRGNNDAPPQPMIDHVPPGALAFRYRDEHGTDLGEALDPAARARIRHVEIRLGVEYPNPDPALRDPLVVTYTASVQLRNAH